MDIQRAAELLAARSTKDFGNALKDRGDPFKDFYKSLPICILDAVFSIGVRYTSVVNVVTMLKKRANGERQYPQAEGWPLGGSLHRRLRSHHRQTHPQERPR